MPTAVEPGAEPGAEPGVEAGVESGPDRRLDAVLRYARAHHGPGLVVGLLLLTGVDLAFGAHMLVFPGQHGAGLVGVPMRRELPIVFAALAAGSLHSRMNTLEHAAAGRLRRYEAAHLAGAALAAVALVAGAELVVSGPSVALVLARATVIWLGLALLSGRLFGRWLSWILPVATIFPLTYLGQDSSGHSRWWDWTGEPPTSPLCAAIAVAALLAGLLAFGLTPWQLASLRRTSLRRTSLRRTFARRA